MGFGLVPPVLSVARNASTGDVARNASASDGSLGNHS